MIEALCFDSEAQQKKTEIEHAKSDIDLFEPHVVSVSLWWVFFYLGLCFCYCLLFGFDVRA